MCGKRERREKRFVSCLRSVSESFGNSLFVGAERRSCFRSARVK